MTFIENYKKNAAALKASYAYDPRDEHDACGVGLIAAIDGKPSRAVVEAAVEALTNVWHRGAVDADGKTGDGAGIQVEIPQAFFAEHVADTGHVVDGHIAVGQVFLPRTDLSAQERARVIVEREILGFGYRLYGWRQVPTDTSCLGQKANAVRPEIEQVMIQLPVDADLAQVERDLYIIRRRIEAASRDSALTDLYLCSLSTRSLVYKGMFLAEDLTTFYPDLVDPRFQSSFALYHQRYSTNTFPTWWLAQPFRMAAHNGEINTIKGNENWMSCHETRFEHPELDPFLDDIRPVIATGSSDTAALDNAFELLCVSGRELPVVKSILIPEAWTSNQLMRQEHKDFYAYCNSVMEPWDGPAAVAAAHGDWALCGLDRSGLRPMRYSVTADGLFICGSETGMVSMPEDRIIERGRLGPGEMIAVNLAEGRLYHNDEIKDWCAQQMPVSDWVANIDHLDEATHNATEPELFDSEELRRRQASFGQSLEDLELILHPMVLEAKESIGSMGDDTPLAVLSDHYRPLHHFFRQNFSQVTNPPIDSLREYNVMSLTTRLGNLGNILIDGPQQCDIMQLKSPVLTNGQFEAVYKKMGNSAVEIDCTMIADTSGNAFRACIDRLKIEAETAVRAGKLHLILSDMNVGTDRVALPMILACGAVHSHLSAQGLRTFTSITVRSGECIDTHYFAVLIGVGATTVNAYLAQESIADRLRRGLMPDGMTLEAAMARYKEAIDQGLLKIMSKMGIGVISSYRGGYNFEAVGLSRTLVAEFFPGVPSRISGIGLSGIEGKVLERHAHAFNQAYVTLPVGGFYRYRKGGESHAWEAGLMHAMQKAVQTDNYSLFKKYTDGIRKQDPIFPRDLLDFKAAGRSPIKIEEVEAITSIRKRFVTPGMSLGALSHEAHGTLNIAMNRIGAKSVSGEGGEDRARFKPFENGDNANSAIKQVASGRFGVTAEYLNHAREIEIKMAQGAKPGEGGQLPGFKVSVQISKLRHSTPGVTLISPPPHHDIYSIEDLAQLIYDLKQINPEARVCVKLVARSGIGTIAAGVAKAKADVILVSGFNGGTGASPQSSIKFAGLPWELGLAEVHQVLTLNNLRQNVVLRTDGGMRTGRDIVMAAMLGAEEFGVGTASLVAMGCIMVRQCHSNTCPVGVCTQDEALRKKFTGTADHVVNLFSFIAEEVREVLAELGFYRLEQVIGRTDLLAQVSRGAAHLDDLDLNPLLVQADGGGSPAHCVLAEGERNAVPDTLDTTIIKDAKPLFERGEKMQLEYAIENTHRTVGTRLSSLITQKFGMKVLNPGHVHVRLRGSAGQSLGAWAVQGVKLEVLGDANDYVGKGLSGATISVRPSKRSPIKHRSAENTIIGNTVLYGATSGKLFAAGQAGERFCVRNSGASVVVEGCGSNGCEYMTGGTAIILGDVGLNFGAGMTGGMAFVYDPKELLPQKANLDGISLQRIDVDFYEQMALNLIEEHIVETSSEHARQLLNDWPSTKAVMWQVVPNEMMHRLEPRTTHALEEERQKQAS